jgi:hypothetical protein
MASTRAGLIALLSLTSVWPHAAVADDAYVCDGGRLVYARPETLEKLKATDPCVAAYWAPRHARPGDVTQPTDKVPTAIPAPEPLAGPKAGPGKRAGLTKTSPAIRPATLTAAEQPPVEVPAPELRPVRAAGPDAATADFRNVRIINAGPGTPIYRHER